jgi:hypothetical protein
MAIPVINTTTSILGYNQWQYFEYQPFATDTPTSWSCVGLPSGLSCDGTTGKISGSASVPGVFLCPLTATNGDGASTPLLLTIGIAAMSAVLTDSSYQVAIDVVTRELTVIGTAAAALPVTSVSPELVDLPANAAQLFGRQNDHVLLSISFTKNGAALDLTISALKIVLKELDSDSSRIVVGSTFHKFGSGTGSYFGLYADLSTATGLADILSNYYGDAGTLFNALAQISWTETNANSGTFGPASWNFTSRNFLLAIEDDMAV